MIMTKVTSPSSPSEKKAANFPVMLQQTALMESSTIEVYFLFIRFVWRLCPVSLICAINPFTGHAIHPTLNQATRSFWRITLNMHDNKNNNVLDGEIRCNASVSHHERVTERIWCQHKFQCTREPMTVRQEVNGSFLANHANDKKRKDRQTDRWREWDRWMDR